jgi:hypothetical protein
MNEQKEKKDVKGIIGTVIVILIILFAISWSYGAVVKKDADGNWECYNIYGKRVGCERKG